MPVDVSILSIDSSAAIHAYYDGFASSKGYMSELAPVNPDRDVCELPEIGGLLRDLQVSGPAQRRAVAQLYAAFAGRLRQYFCRHGSQPAEAEDFLQDVFVRMLRSLPEFRGEPAQFVGWVWAIARNRLLDARRASGRRPQLDLDDPDALGVGLGVELGADPATSDPAALTEAASQQDCVRRGFAAFAAAHPERAQCLSWLATDEMDIAEVARTLGRTLGATREFLSQARKKLRPYIEPCLALPDAAVPAP